MSAKPQPPAHPASELIAEIARQILLIETLEERRMDSLDFHEVAVWQVQGFGNGLRRWAQESQQTHPQTKGSIGL